MGEGFSSEPTETPLGPSLSIDHALKLFVEKHRE